jgi:hypothetical protein
MTSKEITETIELLQKFFNLHSTCHVSTFEGYRKAPDGSEKKVTFTISDHGEDAVAHRYFAAATWDGGQAGGEGVTIKEALVMQFPWDQQPTAPVAVVNPIVNFINPDNQQKPGEEGPAGSSTGPA